MVGGLPCRQFPQIFAIAQNRNVKVGECFRRGNGAVVNWQTMVPRRLNDWEIDKYELMFSILSNISL